MTTVSAYIYLKLWINNINIIQANERTFDVEGTPIVALVTEIPDMPTEDAMLNIYVSTIRFNG